VEDLDREITMEFRIVDAEDDAHTAATELAEDEVPTKDGVAVSDDRLVT